MVFSSHIFLFYFLPIFLFVYYLLPFTWKNLYLRNTWITLGSYVFYGWLVPWYIIPMFCSTAWDYVCGKIITKPGQVQWKRKTALVTAIVGDLSLLAFFKYTPLALQAYDRLNGLFGVSSDTFHLWHLVLPAGISFYTFVALLHHRPLPRRGKAGAEFPIIYLFYRALSSSYRRPDHPLQHRGRNAF